MVIFLSGIVSLTWRGGGFAPRPLKRYAAGLSVE
jgi:hypothetical protein